MRFFASRNQAVKISAVPEPDRLASSLERLFASAEFARSEKTRRLLRYLVESSDPSERSIAQHVFDRGADWDPKIDTVVRIAILRLRAKLENYYSLAGKDDPIRILLPKGGYSVKFEYLGDQLAALTPRVADWAGPFTLTATAALLLAVVAFWLQSQTQAKLPYPIFSVTPFATEIGVEASPAISPDGHWVAYVWDGDTNNFDIYIKSVDGKESRRFTMDPEADLSPAWSPDGKSIAFFRTAAQSDQSTSLVVKPFPPGEERVVARILTEAGNWTGSAGPLLGDAGPVWSPDGRSLLFEESLNRGRSAHGIVELNLASGEKRALTATDGEVRDFYPRISRDGKELAFVRYRSHGVGELYVANRYGGSPVALTSDHRTIRGLTWAGATGQRPGLIYSSNRNGSFQLWSISASGGAPALVPLSSSSAAEPATVDDGQLLAFVECQENWNIWGASIHDGKLQTPVRVASSSGRNYDPRYSPDGKRIAFLSDRSGSWQIWVAAADGAGPAQLTHFPSAWLGSLAWSPDATQIAFDARPEGHAAIYSVSLETGVSKRITAGADEERSPSWSRDGKSIYFNSNRDGSVACYRRNLASGEEQRVSPPGTFTVAESFDGQNLYIDKNIAGELWESARDGSGLHILPTGAKLFPSICFAVFSRGVVFTSLAADSKYRLVMLSSGVRQVLGETSAPIVSSTPSISAAPDGSSLLWAQIDQTTSDVKLRRGMLR